MHLLDLVTSRYPQSKRTTLRRMIQAGRVSVNGIVARSAKHEVRDGDDVQVRDQAPPREPRSPRLPFPIIHEDVHILVIDKPAGLLTSTVPREPRPTALAMVKAYVAAREPRARVGLIHRLDRDASGLLIFSKNNAAYVSLKEQFFRHTVERVYAAIVSPVPTPARGRIDSRLIELPDGRVVNATRPGKGQRAVTEYETIARGGKLGLLRVRLQTGRKHQIRAQLAQRGSPILNDPMYGPSPKTDGRLMLVASELHVTHPRTGKRMRFSLELPEEMRSLRPQ
jgi:RluA family pseudouridine synthase